MSKINQAVILAGGKGVRLRERLNGLPKPLIRIDNIPLLERQILSLKEYGITKIVILVNYKAETIKSYCEEKNNWGLNVECIDDGEPKGTAGAVLFIIHKLEDEFFVIYGDTLFNIDFNRFIKFHRYFKGIGGTLFLHPNDHPADSDLVELTAESYISAFHSYPHPTNVYLSNVVNAALYILSKKALLMLSNITFPADFARDIFPLMLKKNISLAGYLSPEYIKDAGTPSRLDKVESDLKKGILTRASLKYKQKAVFIDRDGTLNEDKGYITKPGDLEVYNFVGPALQKLNTSEWKSIIITNQPVIARGECSENDLRKIHAKLEFEVAKNGAYFDRIYYCPHHPDKGFTGERAELKLDCDCRKPSDGLIQKAKLDFNLDLNECWLIGDSTADLGAAYRAGISSILVESGNAGLDDKFPYNADFTLPTFKDAVEFILKEYNYLSSMTYELCRVLPEARNWFIGGLSRSGKTTIAGVLKRSLGLQGKKCVIISLDRWIKDIKERGNSVIERFDMNLIMEVWNQVNKEPLDEAEIIIPYYSKKERKRLEHTLSLLINTHDIIIWEGVIAIELAKRLNHLNSSIYIEVDEKVRKERMFRDYKVKGFNNEYIENLYKERELDEHGIVKNSGCQARYKFAF
jgi:D,D-heptose 1,7-bisphosphate phosphatase